jgi:methylphosphotriester-DNA--protein-cysteine methyltransferase
MSIKSAAMSKKWRPCLRCNKSMYSDAAHRLCRCCTIRNDQSRYRTVRVSGELASLGGHKRGFEEIG